MVTPRASRWSLPVTDVSTGRTGTRTRVVVGVALSNEMQGLPPGGTYNSCAVSVHDVQSAAVVP